MHFNFYIRKYTPDLQENLLKLNSKTL